ncbi:MAG: Ornithine cyclodeaminase, partial [Chloroflexi bacterium]|nr:Ornithine cyclodeaminase [Chloroflexota bacterium]
GAGNRRLQGITAVYAYDDMGMIAVLEDGHLNDVRTAAPTGVAARHLSNPDSSELAIIGTGELAAGQLAAVCAVRPIKRIRAYSRTPEHVTRFASTAGELLQREIVPCASGEEAVADADIVITITNARQPVIDRSWIARGTTVLCIAILDSRVVTTSVQRLLDPGEKIEPFLMLVSQGRFGPADVVELGDVVIGKAQGRRNPEELITFISTGSPHWDVAVPMMAVRRAQRLGIGLEWP